MKQGNALVNFVMIALAVALACYLGIYAWDSFNDPFSTTYAYEYTASDAVEAEGYLARRERVFSPQSGIVDVIRGEGERVGVGQRVARIYQNSQAMAIQEEMDQLVAEISVLEYALGQSDGSVSTAQLDEKILKSIVQLRSAAAGNDYSDLEDQVMAVKSQVLKRDYTYGEDLDLTQLDQRRKELVSEYRALESQSSGASSSVRAPEAGTFSALVDGYETVLTPESIFSLTPAQLDNLSDLRVEQGDCPGKLVTSNKWYFVTALKAEDARRLRAGNEVLVRFSGDLRQDITMLVEQVGEAEEERCAVVLSTERYLGETLLLRTQNAEIVFEQFGGLRVPKTSVRMVTKTVTDSETGTETQVNTLGVYAVVGGQAEFKAVDIAGEGSDYYVVTPVGTGSRVLRAGDEIVVRATELYDGKLLEY